MKKTVSRLGSAALCVTLSLALGCGCAVMPPASSEKPASSAASVPTDAEGKPLYDATRLDDGRLRILYGYDNSGDCRTCLPTPSPARRTTGSAPGRTPPAGAAAAVPCMTRTAAK